MLNNKVVKTNPKQIEVTAERIFTEAAKIKRQPMFEVKLKLQKPCK